MPLDARSISPSDDEPFIERELCRVLADPEFRAAAVEIVTQAVADARLPSPIDPVEFGRLLAVPHIQQQLWAIAGAVMLRGYG